jgi:hypothetical protein
VYQPKNSSFLEKFHSCSSQREEDYPYAKKCDGRGIEILCLSITDILILLEQEQNLYLVFAVKIVKRKYEAFCFLEATFIFYFYSFISNVIFP